MARRKTPYEIALTGPLAARALDIDGFRDGEWPVMSCMPHAARPRPGVIRVRRCHVQEVGGVLMAKPWLVLRHLADDVELLRQAQRRDGVRPDDRVELAMECMLHRELVTLEELHFRGGSFEGDRAMRRVLARRPNEPPTESYMETRFWQFLYRNGFDAWRQVPIVNRFGRIEYRVDFVIHFVRRARRRPRPLFLTPADGVLAEVDSREFHQDAFERDHERQSTYDALGFRSMMITPNQLEHRPAMVLAAINGALSSGRPSVRRVA
jgi:hypothetical protein